MGDRLDLPGESGLLSASRCGFGPVRIPSLIFDIVMTDRC